MRSGSRDQGARVWIQGCWCKGVAKVKRGEDPSLWQSTRIQEHHLKSIVRFTSNKTNNAKVDSFVPASDNQTNVEILHKHALHSHGEPSRCLRLTERAHRPVHHSTLGSRVIKKKKKVCTRPLEARKLGFYQATSIQIALSWSRY